MPQPDAPARPIVVFDGECGLCNGFVAWLVRHDHAGAFLLAGSSGEAGRAAIAAAGLPSDIGASTIVLARPGASALVRSDAVLAVMRGLPRPWRWLAWPRALPRGPRDRVYRFVAARRSRVHAEDPGCGVPPADLVRRWRSRLATVDDAARLAGG